MGILQKAIQNGKELGFLYGLTLSNNVTDATNDIDIASGAAADAVGTIMNLAAGITKRLDAAWAVGSGNGGLDTGSIANVAYHVWLIQRSDTGVVDALFSASATAPTMPANYDRKRRIGSVIRKSGSIIAFVQKGDEFLLMSPVNDLASTNPGTSTLNVMLTVPGVVGVVGVFNAWYATTSATASGQVLFSDKSTADVAATGVLFSLAGLIASSSFSASGQFRVSVDNNAQIRVNANYSDAGTVLRITTVGWIDTRGRLAA